MCDIIAHVRCSLHVGLRGAVEPELVMEVELSSWS